ncbi:unnamed protein product [Allacma fusca]|uniref:N-acetyltransferase domain-containing protein n=1 Tax=Allacma fusca TaxID=39272 RepID=A0A8J2KYH3_9HEXA|nr:unnamed protein product [Allacma fusca]
MKAIILAFAIFALASAEEGKVEKRGSAGYAYGAPSVAAAPVAAVAAAPAAVAAPAVAVATFKSSAPVGYSNAIPAAAIRNVETVGVTKTITPVVTKTTTYNTHSEPAVSVGHVQGYSQSAVGAPKVAPVQFSTQYTSYVNPTVGLNGPVTYAGPAHATGYAVAAQPALGYAQAGLLGLNLAQFGYAQQGISYAQPAIAAYAQPGLAAYAQPALAAYAQPAVHAYAQPAIAAYAQPAVASYAAGAPTVVSSTTYAAPSVTTYSKVQLLTNLPSTTDLTSSLQLKMSKANNTTTAILPITEADLPILADLINAAYRGIESQNDSSIEKQSRGWTNEIDFVEGSRINLDHSKELETSDTVSVLKLEEEGKIQGCVRLEQQGNVAQMSMLSVLPNSQARGVGSRLIQASEDWAKNRGCSAIKITVIAGRTTLVDYYKRRNFQETGEVELFVIGTTGSGIPKDKDMKLCVLKKELK